MSLLPCAHNRGLRAMLITLDGRSHPCTSRKPESLIQQRLFKRREEQQDIRFLAGVPHQSDAPDFALDRAQAAGDLDVELVEQLAANPTVFNSGRNVDGRDGYQGIGSLLKKEIQAPR